MWEGNTVAKTVIFAKLTPKLPVRYPLIIITLLLCCICHAQIKTPPFTNYTSCPTSFSQVDRCTGWRQPTEGTSDYFNACSPGLPVGIPYNTFGSQTATDSAYTGLYAYVNESSLQDYREYIATSFKALTVGKTYTMTITVSLADNSTYGTDGLGALFTTYPVDMPDHRTTLPMKPQVDYSGYGPITDKANWVTLTGTFIADSAYTHLTVGCFKDDTDITVDSVSAGSLHYAYYYIGSIGIPDPDWTPPDTTAPPPVDTTTPPPPIDTTHGTDGTVFYLFPTAFTPNNDGRNDVFRIIGSADNDYKDYSLRVYDRWGQCVFVTHDPNAGWNGYYNGQQQDAGVFFYLCEFGLNSRHVTLKGDVTLVR